METRAGFQKNELLINGNYMAKGYYGFCVISFNVINYD